MDRNTYIWYNSFRYNKNERYTIMKKAMIYGLGISGTGAKELLEKEGYETIVVDDKKAMTSEEALNHLDGLEFFIKSPGIPYNDFVKEVQKRGIKILDEIEIAYNYMIEKGLKTKIIAITGTNGKSTTTAKISDMLNHAGYKAAYAGNIGRSLSEVLLKEKDLDFISLELSSFQLENVENFKPYISMIINMGPDHIERYKSFDEYYDTKFNITKNQTEDLYFIENIDDVEIEKRAKQIKAKRISVSKFKKADIFVKNDKICHGENTIIDVDKLSLKGIHNLENTLFMVATAEILKIDKEKLKEFLMIATPLEHRTELFFNYGKLKFINDSKATNVDSTKFAIQANKNSILICGGYDKGVDLAPLAEMIKENIKEVYLIGVIADKIERELKKIGYEDSRIHKLVNIENSLQDMKKRFTKDSDEVILLSPATSSYDQFNSFEHRGKVFKELVLKIFG
ncbi:MAG TPA: UDP-N-acetylmuramoyl-L-alanine--D-glutamate ligase [Fusobacterium sp.]|uniref:UDP-N-acetylmuramoylalanine--D-glutamate ligase n=2 Tax=Fusobacterium TaxID=848 RepID=A0A323TUE3_FUSNU|nr:UDP-N-acetylmuramoyl-L-alanine--D-glutamate ligase [Fusobacterium nucleatum]PZA04211.1 UDP-N-acetylmuramoyl-L-alanine--D-glutamate ligase [Fusobacterium nucleatum]HCE32807.1 UDP-N-acetylmuramoyl-L-alanine--D-glutamate ligase [Fusobacterium sp.]